jgi:NAD+ diphosphatase
MERGMVEAPGFTGAGIDRADHLRLDPERLVQLAGDPAARLLRLDGLDPLLDAEGRLCWQRVKGGEEMIFLGLQAGEPLFAPVPNVEPGQAGWSVMALIAQMRGEEAALWGGARSLVEWHSRHRFCGLCGGRTSLFRGGWGRKCKGCGADHFPRVDPVVIVLAEHDGRVLVGRQHRYPPGRYSALAGFVEPGESIEEAVARELMEEAGIVATDVRYAASQPWPFPGQLMIACLATSASDSLRLDAQELEHAMWVDRAGVEAAIAGAPGAPFLAPPPYAIAHSLLRHWLGA